MDISYEMKERIKAIVSAVVIVIVNVFALMGVNTIDGDALTNAILGILACISWIWAIWKNHNFTGEAAEAQVLLDNLKKMKREARHEKGNDDA